MEKLCEKCIHCYRPKSIKDFFDNTMKMPDISKWGVDVFKHLFWLCDTEPVSESDQNLRNLRTSHVLPEVRKRYLYGNA